jgi:ABC-type branched-subunit amino acid transport system substrate-binding protein
VRGAELAVDELNDAGGLLGQDVELVVTDGADLVELPRRLADLAEHARVSAVIGPEAPGVLVGPRSPLTRRGVPALLPSAFAGDLEGASTLVARTVPSAAAQAETLARWLVAERDADQLAVLVADPVEGAAARAAIEAGAAPVASSPTAVVEVDARGPLTTAVQTLRRRAPDADAVLLWGWPDAAARATLAVRELGWDVQVMVGSSAFVGEYRALAGEASEGVVLPFPFREEWFGPELTTWMLRYQAQHGIGALPGMDTLVIDVPAVALAAYDAVGRSPSPSRRRQPRAGAGRRGARPGRARRAAAHLPAGRPGGLGRRRPARGPVPPARRRVRRGPGPRRRGAAGVLGAAGQRRVPPRRRP